MVTFPSARTTEENKEKQDSTAFNRHWGQLRNRMVEQQSQLCTAKIVFISKYFFFKSKNGCQNPRKFPRGAAIMAQESDQGGGGEVRSSGDPGWATAPDAPGGLLDLLHPVAHGLGLDTPGGAFVHRLEMDFDSLHNMVYVGLQIPI